MPKNEKDKLRDKIQGFKKSIQDDAEGHSRHGLFSRLTFRWVSRYIYFANRQSVDYDMMPNLTVGYLHSYYSARMNHAFQQAISRLRPEQKPNGKSFIPKLIWSCFKWEMICVFLLLFVVKALEYSTSFFIHSILKIKDTYKPDEYKSAFISFCTMMLLAKLVNSILTENVAYFVVV